MNGWKERGNKIRGLEVNGVDVVKHHYTGGKESIHYLVGSEYKTQDQLDKTDIREVLKHCPKWVTVLSKTLTEAEKTLLILIGEKK